MKKIAVLAVLISIASKAAFSAPVPIKKIAILDVINETALEPSDVLVMGEVISTAFKTLPLEAYSVGKIDNFTIDAPCDDTCRVRKASESGVDLAVLPTLSTFGDGYILFLKLFDCHTGQLVQSETATGSDAATELLPRVKSAAETLISELSKDADDLPPPRTPKRSYPVVIGHSDRGRMVITSEPPGAAVYVGHRHHPNYIGRTPISKYFPQHHYRVRVVKKGYGSVTRDVAMASGKTLRLRFHLYRSKKLMGVGHAVFWPGLIGTGIGTGLLAAGKTKSGAIVTGIFGSLVATGTTLFIVGAVRLKKEKAERIRKRHRVTFDADRESGELTYTFSF